MLIVQKFGGSSLADMGKMSSSAAFPAEAFRQGKQVIVVVSACGDTTDSLNSEAHAITSPADQRELDSLLSTGEQHSAALMALTLQKMGIPARSYTGYQAGIFAEGPHGDGRIRLILPERLKNALNAGLVPVVAGFQGINFKGDICTLGRGGSDTTAVALSAALGAECCEIYTDVSGIYTADPRLIKSARFLRKVDYRDMLLLSRCGSQVLQYESVRIAMANRLKLRLLSSAGGSEGSELCFLPDSERPGIAGITRDSRLCSVSAVGPSAGCETLSALEKLLSDAGICVLSALAESGCVSLFVAPEQLLPALNLLHTALIESPTMM